MFNVLLKVKNGLLYALVVSVVRFGEQEDYALEREKVRKQVVWIPCGPGLLLLAAVGQ